MASSLDLEASLLLLELEPPFDHRAVQLARRRMAKRWHPDIAPADRRHEHQLHLQAINQAADKLERVAESSRGGRMTPETLLGDIRDRLAEHDHHLALRRDPDGYSWDVPERPMRTRRVFETADQALEHAYVYVKTWYR